jgi:predicted ThiF/HesA family dinucleotide-utilizing enzyme
LVRFHVITVLKPKQTALVLAGVVLPVVWVGLPSLALADIAQIAVNVKRNTNAALDATVYVFYAAGIYLTASGVMKAIAKSRGDQNVTTGSVFGYAGGGVALMAVTYLADQLLQSTLGGGAEGSIGTGIR